MKKIFIILVSILVITSCEDDLNQAPLSEVGSNGFYKNADDIKVALNGVYERLDAYPVRAFYMSEIRSDNVWGVSQGGVRPWDPINNFSTNLPTSDVIRDAWNINYNAIMGTNAILDAMQDESLVGDDAALRARLIAEARFMRAFSYFDLVRYFGGVPLITTLVTPEASLEISRSPVTDVYTVILEDLQFAIDNLDETYTGIDVGRPTKDAARAYKALVHLTRSGPTYGIKGPGLAVNEYSDALTLLNAIISGGRHATESVYADIFSYNNELNDGNTEIIFDIQYIGGGLGLGGQWPGEFVPESFPRTTGGAVSGGLDVKRISLDFIANMDTANDVRWLASVQQGWTDLTGTFRDDLFYNKWIDFSRYPTDRFEYELNYPLMRYTDVLMLKAEAILQGASGTQAEVDLIINDVRTRAGIPTITNATLDDLIAERRREFMGEGLRWHTLVRTGKVIDVMNAWLRPAEPGSDVMPTEMNANFIIYPLNQAQIDIKPGLYEQNPGY
ncbi:MAG: RagB/SusD family nutrient uptake outer membrane protein [Marinoscillum sp.]